MAETNGLSDEQRNHIANILANTPDPAVRAELFHTSFGPLLNLPEDIVEAEWLTINQRIQARLSELATLQNVKDAVTELEHKNATPQRETRCECAIDTLWYYARIWNTGMSCRQERRLDYIRFGY